MSFKSKGILDKYDSEFYQREINKKEGEKQPNFFSGFL
jgi:hypothetical protein